MEKEINKNHIIDNIEVVENKLNELIENPDISKVVEFVNSEVHTIFYFNRYLSEKTGDDGQTCYAWVDSGYCYNNEPIFISLVKYGDEYCGHYVGIPFFLVKGLISRNAHYKEYMHNLEKFKIKYNRRIEQRLLRHLDIIPIQKNINESKNVTEIKQLLNRHGFQASENSYDILEETDTCGFPIQTEMTAVTEEIYTNLLYPRWKSKRGLDRYIKIIGRRIEQLIIANKTEYFVINNIRSVVVNTGLIDLFGNDVMILYKINQKYGTYVAYQVISGKKDYFDNNFNKDQATVELKPIQFTAGNKETLKAAFSDFDLNNKCLIHIIEERRNRFPEKIQNESVNRIFVKLEESLRHGLKIQARDHSYAKLTYSAKDGMLSWLLPLHVNNDFTQEPELVMVIRKVSDFYEVKTVLPYNDDLKDRITALSLYRNLW